MLTIFFIDDKFSSIKTIQMLRNYERSYKLAFTITEITEVTIRQRLFTDPNDRWALLGTRHQLSLLIGRHRNRRRVISLIHLITRPISGLNLILRGSTWLRNRKCSEWNQEILPYLCLSCFNKQWIIMYAYICIMCVQYDGVLRENR